MKIIIAGGSGFIGTALTDTLLNDDHTVLLLTRKPGKINSGTTNRCRALYWDGKTIGEWSKELDGADAVINLSGENIAAGRWSENRKKQLTDSRIYPTRVIVDAIAKAAKKPAVLINASAIGYYGSDVPGPLTELDKPGSGFLPDLCVGWEEEALKAEMPGVRVVLLRTGVVLDPSGGALKKMLLPFKLCIGGPLGSGTQWLSWIHRDDLVRAIVYVLGNDSVRHAVNGTAPAPVTMDEFAKTLGSVMHRPSWMRVPSFVLKIALGEMAESVLEGSPVLPDVLIHSGFTFRYRDLKSALESFFH